jgi:hypothetical protein
MLGKILINGLFLLGLLLAPAWAAELLPAGVVNTAQEGFGNLVSGGDYGLGNVVPVEVVGQGERREVRIFRSPELQLSRKKRASMQILVGNVRILYVWIETPPVQGMWQLSVDAIEQDGTRRPLFSRQLNPGVPDQVNVEPHTRLDCQVYSKTTAIKFNRRFILNFSPPEVWATYPAYAPIPHRALFD